MIPLLAQTANPERAQTLEKLRRLDEHANELGRTLQDVQSGIRELQSAVAGQAQLAEPASRLDIFHGYIWVLVIAFVVTLVTTPLMRRLAIANGIVDTPTDPRKVHKLPTAYLGGVAVFFGLLAGILYSYLAEVFPGLLTFHRAVPDNLRDGIQHHPVPFSIVLGMCVITLVGLIDDAKGIIPRVKIGGQLLAAAMLAIQDVGVRVAANVLGPVGALFGNPELTFHIPLPLSILGADSITLDLIYWTGTAIIAVFVLGACNASNLIDGLDGLLTGVTAIAGLGLLVIALGLAAADDGPRDAQRIILCMALVGACLGFLPHNFNPATIFLGDAGSLLLGFMTIVIVLTLGNEGQTQLVLAGLIIYAIPMIDTSLAIVRRKLNRQSISAADDQHLHHMLKRALGVKGAVLTLYGIGACFAALGVVLSLSRARVVYLLALLLVAYIGVTAIKLARRRVLEEQATRPPNPANPANPAAPAAPAIPSNPAETPAPQRAEPLPAGPGKA